jgi:deoxyribodipyrimidine photolyase-related protein
MTGETACPFNALYWDFFARNRNKLEANQRLPFVYTTWDKFSPDRQTGIKDQAASVFSRMAQGLL